MGWDGNIQVGFMPKQYSDDDGRGPQVCDLSRGVHLCRARHLPGHHQHLHVPPQVCWCCQVNLKSNNNKKAGTSKDRERKVNESVLKTRCCFRQNVVDQSTIQTCHLTGAIIVKSKSRISRPTDLQRIFVICLHNISLSVTHYVTCSQKLHFESKCSTILTDI